MALMYRIRPLFTGILALFAILAVSCVLFSSAEVRAEVDINGTAPSSFVVASSDNFPPINFLDENGQLTGFGRDLSSAVIRSMGGEASYIHSHKWAEVLEWLESGTADLIHDTAYSEERSKFLDFSDPILEMDEVIFVRSNEYDISGISSLAGKKVACVEQHITHLYLQKFPEIECFMVDSPLDGLYHLINGDVDAFVYPEPIGLYYVQNYRLEDKIKRVEGKVRTLKWSMVVRKGDKALLDMLNKGIAKVQKSGEYTRIYNKWFGRKLLAGYNRKESAIIISAVALISILSGALIAFCIMFRRIKASNKRLEEAAGLCEMAADEIRESQESLESAQRIARVGNWDWDVEEDSIYWSDEMFRILGLDPDEQTPTYQVFIDRVHPIDRPEVNRAMKDARLRGIPIDLDHRIVLPDGSEKCVHEQAEVSLGSGGIVSRIVGTVQDITERKLAEKALRESERRYRSTLDNMMEGCQIISTDWHYLYVNDTASKHGRMAKEELLGRTMMEVYPDIDKTQLFAILKQCMEERKSSFIENEFTYPDGSKGWFELSIQPVPEGLFILSNDITERKKAEEKLQMQIAELKTWHSVTLDREDRIIELKKEVNELLKVMNRSPRYDVDGDDRKGVS